MKNLFSKIHNNRGILYSSLVVILAHTIPMLGVFMDGKWYQYPYILISYIIGLAFVLKTCDKIFD